MKKIIAGLLLLSSASSFGAETTFKCESWYRASDYFPSDISFYTGTMVVGDDYVQLLNWKAKPHSDAWDPLIRANAVRGMNFRRDISPDENGNFQFKLGNLKSKATRVDSLSYQIEEEPYTGGANPLVFSCKIEP